MKAGSYGEATKWRDEHLALAKLLQATDLEEGFKWGKPCYAVEGKNIGIVQRMNGFLTFMFFNGALLKDDKGLLHAPGPNSRCGGRLHFTSVKEVKAAQPALRALIEQAIALNRAGAKVGPPPKLVLVEELQSRLNGPNPKKPHSKASPEADRGSIVRTFQAPKQPRTRERRIDKVVPKILEGKGFRER